MTRPTFRDAIPLEVEIVGVENIITRATPRALTQSHAYTRKVSAKAAAEIRAAFIAGTPRAAIARRHGVSLTTVWRVGR